MPQARDLGFPAAVALVVGNMIGSGVFLLPASLAPYRGTSLVGWTISTIGSVLLGIVIAALLSTALIAMNYPQSLVALFTRIILLATLSTLVPYLFCSLASFVRGKTDRPAARSPGGVVAGLVFLYAMVAVAGAGQEVVYLGFLLLLAGLPVFAWVTRRG